MGGTSERYGTKSEYPVSWHVTYRGSGKGGNAAVYVINETGTGGISGPGATLTLNPWTP